MQLNCLSLILKYPKFFSWPDFIILYLRTEIHDRLFYEICFMNCCRIMCMFDKQTYVSSRSYFSFLCYLKQQFVSLSPRWMLSLLCQIQNDEFLIKVNSLKKERREEGLKGGAQYVWNTNVHFQSFFFFLGQMNGRAFWNETAQQDQETCQIFFSFCFFSN